jgi:hypothetical protein
MLLIAYFMCGLVSYAFIYANSDTIKACMAGDETIHDHSLPKIETLVIGI